MALYAVSPTSDAMLKGLQAKLQNNVTGYEKTLRQEHSEHAGWTK